MDTKHMMARAALVVACGLVINHGASAQTLTAPTPRPGHGMFDRAGTGDQTLDVTIQTLGAYDDDITAVGTTATPNPTTQQGGPYSMVSANVAYSKRLGHGTFGLSEGSAFRYYPTLDATYTAQHAGAMGLALDFGQTNLSLSESVGVTPWLSFSPIPGLFTPGTAELPASGADQAVDRRDQMFFSSLVSLTQRLSPRSSLTFTSSFQRDEFTGDGTHHTTSLLSGRYSHNMSRDLSVVLGYSMQQRSYQTIGGGVLPTTRLHNVDAGVDYNRALGPTHRTTVGFTTGTALVQDAVGYTQPQITGNFRVNREIGRTWHLVGAYRRGVGFVDGFAGTFFADSFSGSFGGLVNRRLELAFGGGWSNGDLGAVVRSSHSQTLNSSARARFAMTRKASLVAEHNFYGYSFDDVLVVPNGLPPTLNRHSFHVGVEFWLPVIR